MKNLITSWLFHFTAVVVFFTALPLSPLHAATWYVDGGVDSSSQYGFTWADAFKSLQEAIDAAQVDDLILVKEGRYPLSASIEIDKAVHIYGGFPSDFAYPEWDDRDVTRYETVLDGQYTVYNLLYITANATVDGLTIRNGDDGCSQMADGGGAFIVYASPVISNCTFTDNSVDLYGGALYLKDSNAQINNCNFDNNYAEGSGAAIYLRGSAPVIDNCTFTENDTAKYGGGLFNYYSSPTITKCKFFDNTAEYGGALNIQYSSPIIKNSIISGNSAVFKGGGIFNRESDCIITDTIFSDNKADVSAGGILNSKSSPEITDCIISNNSAKQAGGILNTSDSYSNISNCTFWGNQAVENGGGICNYNSMPTISNCTFTENSVGLYGGAVYLYNSNTLISNCNFEKNYAEGSGAGIYLRESSPVIDNCTFTENDTARYGGGIFNYYSSPLITKCDFFDNTAEYGGALNIQYSSPTINNTVFYGNRAVFKGGGIYNRESDLIITNANFSSNVAGDSAGGILNSKASPEIAGCVFYNNSAHQAGGMLNTYGSFPGINNCAFLGNQAVTFGGGMSNYNSTPFINNSFFSGNKAYIGGGLYNNNTIVNMANCTLSGNRASYGGGIMTDNCTDDVISNCVMWGNVLPNNASVDNGPQIYTYTDYSSVGFCNIDQSGFGNQDGSADGKGNIRKDPLFVRAPDPGADEEWGTDDDDYGDLHLTSFSPCIDAGSNEVAHLLSTDPDGDPRIVDGDDDGVAVVDMGMDEFIHDQMLSSLTTDLLEDDIVSMSPTYPENDTTRMPQDGAGGNGSDSQSLPDGTGGDIIVLSEVKGQNGEDSALNVPLAFHYTCRSIWPSLKNPWYFEHPAGVAVDPWGNLYVADTGKHGVQKFSPGGKFIAAWGGPGAGHGQFSYPTGIATDLYGNVYVADTDNHRIQKFDPNGNFILEICEQISDNDTLSYPQGVAVDQGGDIYVADTFNDRIVKFNPDGQLIAMWGSYGNGSGEFDLPRGIASDRNGHIYVVDRYNHRIQMFHDDGTFLMAWGSEGDGGSQLDSPLGIAVGLDSEIYVTDSENHRIVKLRDDGSGFVSVAVMGACGTGQDSLCTPAGIAVDADGYVYVADVWNNRIQKFHDVDVELDYVFALSNRGARGGEFISPESVTVDEKGYVYVADTDNHRIQKLGADGAFLFEWSRNDTKFVQGIAADTQGDIYAASADFNQVTKYAGDGNFLAYVNKYIKDDVYKFFYKPYGIAFDDQGNIYVVDRGNNYVVKFNPNFNDTETVWGGQGIGAGYFRNPHGIAVDVEGRVYVADTDNHRIQKFSSAGEYIGQWGVNGSSAGEFNAPRGVATDNESGTVVLYVADSGNHRIQKFSASGDFIQSFGSYGTSPGQFNDPGGLCIGNDGRIYVADTGNDRIQVFNHLQTPNSKAVIVAGRSHEGDALWNATSMNAKFAYRALLYQGFTKDTICYLSPDIQWDQDNNGEFDDVDGIASRESLHTALTEWSGDADSLVVCLIDHGGPEIFRLNKQEVLHAGELSQWLDGFSGPTTVVYDACRSGSFLQALKKANRTLITSTDVNQRAQFLGGGAISFSNYFWNHIFNGVPVREAMEKAGTAVESTFHNQTPLSEPSDISADLVIGYGTSISGSAPEIAEIYPDTQTITSGTTATIRANRITDPDSATLSGVWAVVLPPGFSEDSIDNPMVELPFFELQEVDCDGYSGKCYEGSFDKFTIDGEYQLAVYAMDDQGNTSVPLVSEVKVESPLTQKAIIVAGTKGGDGFVEKGVDLAYHALKTQGYKDGVITVLEPDGSASISSLRGALEAARNSTHDLVLYLVGQGGPLEFHINDSEILSVSELDSWLDELQANMDGVLTVIYDADYSGSFIPLLTPPENKKRIVITSTAADEPVYYGSRGLISFSTFFWSRVYNGEKVHDAFSYAKKASNCLNKSCRPQTPSLNDNGNGIANEYADGLLAMNYKIGIGWNFADDGPMVGSVFAEAEENNRISIQAGVTGTGEVKRVWAVVTPIDSCPGGDEAVEEVELFYDIASETATGLFEPTSSQDYKITVYARDADNNTSRPFETKVYLGQGGLCSAGTADAYEEDNSKEEARVIVVNAREPQEHSFCSARDEDWVKFYGLEGEYYSIVTDNLGENSLPVIELYNEQLDMQRSKVPEEGGAVYLDWLCPEDGVYYVRLWNYLLYDEDGQDTVTTGYSLRVYNPYWPDFLVLMSGEVKDGTTRQPIDGAVITTDGGGAAISEQGRYELYQYPGRWTLEARSSGYQWYREYITVGTGSMVMQKDISMLPLSTNTSTTTSIDSSSSSPPATTTTVPVETTSSTTTTIDDGNLATTTTTVAPPPEPLEIVSTPRAMAFVDEQYTYTVEVSGGAAVTCELQSAPAGMVIDKTTGTITWTPALEQLGNHRVVVCVTDDLGRKVSQEFTVRVTLSCVLTQVLNNNRQDLDLLRSYRDSRLYRSAAGRGLLYLYYANGPEIYAILAKQPGLMTSVRKTVRELLPELKKGAEKNEPIGLPEDTRRKARRLLKDIRQKASPGLKKSLALVLRRLEDVGFLQDIGIKHSNTGRK